MTDRLGWAVAMVVVVGSTAGRLDAQADPLDRLGWLAGCWEARAGNRVTTETWMVPSGGLMIGGGRTVVDGVARSFEHLRIRADGTRLLYVATPSGQRETTFPSAHLSDTLLVFENPEHDFPQRIAYRRVGADSVVARVEGPRPGGGTRGFSVPMVRAGCTVATRNAAQRAPELVGALRNTRDGEISQGKAGARRR